MTERAKLNMWFWTGCVCYKEQGSLGHQDHEKTQIESKNYMTVIYQCWFSDFKIVLWLFGRISLF